MKQIKSCSSGTTRRNSKVSENKNSIQHSSRSYFRLGKNIERNFFKDKNQNVSMPGIVKGAESFLKSRSKPIRTSVKISEIRPIGLTGVTIINQSKFMWLWELNLNTGLLPQTEGFLQINSKQIVDKYKINEPEPIKEFGLMSINKLQIEKRQGERNNSAMYNKRSVSLLI